MFNVLGEAFDNISLKDLLIDAIRYGEKPETRARMEQVIGQALDTQHLQDLMARNALVENHMSLDDLYAIREEMDKAEARKLQPALHQRLLPRGIPGGGWRTAQPRGRPLRGAPRTSRCHRA